MVLEAIGHQHLRPIMAHLLQTQSCFRTSVSQVGSFRSEDLLYYMGLVVMLRIPAHGSLQGPIHFWTP